MDPECFKSSLKLSYFQVKSKNKKSKRMTPNEIKFFIQHYEKITKWMMRDLNKKAQIVIKFEKNHKISSLNFN